MATEQELERLVVKLIGDATSYLQAMKQADVATKKFEETAGKTNKHVERFKSTMASFGGQFSGMVTGFVGGVGLLNQVTTGVRLAAEAEKMESAFKVMLGSAEKAKTMMADLQKFAAETPLEMGDLTQFTKMLLQAKVPAKDMVSTLRMIGDVAMGDRDKMHRLTYAFQQIKGNTRLQGDELNQLTEAGFNPLEEMTKTTGKTMTQLRGEMAKGMISFEMVRDAFKSASSEGGTFFNGMKEASTTLSGLWSTFQDDLAGVQREIGKEVIQALRLKEVVAGLSSVMQWLTSTFRALPEWVKRGAILLGGLVAVITTLGIIGPAVGAALSFVWGGFLTALGTIASVGWPLITLFVAIGVVVAALVQRAGGVQAVWDAITGKLQEFWEWLKPVRQATESFFTAVAEWGQWAWEQVAYWVGWAYDQVVAQLGAAWRWVEEQTGFTFGGVRDSVRDAFLFMEFVLKNFEAAWGVAWAAMKYFAVLALNTVLKNIFLIIGGVLLGPALLALLVNWRDLWTQMVVAAGAAMATILSRAREFALMFGAALAGKKVDVAGFVRQTVVSVGAAMSGVQFTWKGISIPALDALEEQLRQEFEAKKGTLSQSWEEFKKQKLEEFAKENPQAGDPEQKGIDDGNKYGMGLSKGIKGTEAVLFNSAEALSRRLEYIERLREGREANRASGGTPGSVQGAKVDSVRAMGQQTDLLEDIAKNTAESAKKGGVMIEPANL